MNVQLDTDSRVHLEWMFDNQPALVRELAAQGSLGRHLEERNQAGLELRQRLVKQGLAPDQALEVANAEVLAPVDGPALTQDPAPEPVPPAERQAIYQSLENQ